MPRTSSKNASEISNKALLAELGVEVKQEKKSNLTPKQERIIAGFEEIQKFVEENGHKPEHGEDKDIFERLYATRLDQIAGKAECRELVVELDHQGLLSNNKNIAEPKADYETDKELLEALGVSEQLDNDVSVLKHVKPRAEIRAAEEVANRKVCEDFEKFKPLFQAVQDDINFGERKTVKFSKDGSIEIGNYFILHGQKAYVAEIGEEFIGKDGRKEYRLRVIFDNGVESNQLMRSLQKRLWEDETGRRITEKSIGPLFTEIESEDLASGTIYVLRSKSDDPSIVVNRDLIHKIGVTGGDVKVRISNSKIDPTFLMSDVEIVATYELFNIHRVKLENMLHKFFENTRLDIEIIDRFGKPVKPKEWFLVPLFIIDEVVEKIKDKTISEYFYDRNKASLVKL